MANTFIMPKKIISGTDSLKLAKNEFIKAGKKAFIVTDSTMIKLQNVSKLEETLKQNNINYFIYDEINTEPTTEMVYKGKQLYNLNHCDFLIAIGGGSPIDTMKAIAFLLTTSKELPTFMGKEIEGSLPYMIAIPTTSGTGSEATKFTIITDEVNNVKMLLKGDSLMCDLALIDPSFTLSLPPGITANTGIDALCHAIEAYTSRKHQPLSDNFALSAIKRIFNNLLECYKNPSNLEARKEMSIASLEAGIAFNNSSVTIVHGMSRPIGALFHIPHGLSNAILLEKCMYFVVDEAYDRFADIARYVGIDEDDDVKAAYLFLNKLHNLLKALEIKTLKELNIDISLYMNSIDKMADDALMSKSPANTIKEIKKEDLINLYKSIL